MPTNHTPAETLILHVLKSGSGALTMEDILERLPVLTWNQVFRAVDAMSRCGEVALRKRGFQYEVSCGSTAQAANQATADQPSECNP